jgi:LPXTG-site transpeptidase (sortase) family protein
VGGHLIIPAIDVDAPLEPVGVLGNGDMAVPSRNQWDGVGWYQYGPFPGSRGSAVIDGHLDRPGGLPAVFWRLHDLHVGDMVMVVDKDGKKLRFRVMQTTAYPPDAAPLQNIFGPKNGVFLNLITCAGQWVPTRHQTSLRLVVYTQLVS